MLIKFSVTVFDWPYPQNGCSVATCRRRRCAESHPRGPKGGREKGWKNYLNFPQNLLIICNRLLIINLPIF